MTAPVSYSLEGAAAATGLSMKTISRAIHAGDLPVTYPRVNGRPLAKPVILAVALQEWVASGAPERAAA
jgi:hypothetical protein